MFNYYHVLKNYQAPPSEKMRHANFVEFLSGAPARLKCGKIEQNFIGSSKNQFFQKNTHHRFLLVIIRTCSIKIQLNKFFQFPTRNENSLNFLALFSHLAVKSNLREFPQDFPINKITTENFLVSRNLELD